MTDKYAVSSKDVVSQPWHCHACKCFNARTNVKCVLCGADRLSPMNKFEQAKAEATARYISAFDRSEWPNAEEAFENGWDAACSADETDGNDARDAARYRFIREQMTKKGEITYYSMPHSLMWLRGVRSGAAFDREVEARMNGAAFESPEEPVPAETTGQHSHVYAICTAYESGFGHGLANDGMTNPYLSAGCEREAYRVGRDAGLKRLYGQSSAVEPSPSRSVQRRVAAMREEPAPAFGASEKATAPIPPQKCTRCDRPMRRELMGGFVCDMCNR